MIYLVHNEIIIFFQLNRIDFELRDLFLLWSLLFACLNKMKLDDSLDNFQKYFLRIICSSNKKKYSAILNKWIEFLSVWHISVSIDQNIYCFAPFYVMYVFFLTLHTKFAYSTYRIGIRYRTLNNALRNSTAYGELYYYR